MARSNHGHHLCRVRSRCRGGRAVRRWLIVAHVDHLRRWERWERAWAWARRHSGMGMDMAPTSTFTQGRGLATFFVGILIPSQNSLCLAQALPVLYRGMRCKPAGVLTQVASKEPVRKSWSSPWLANSWLEGCVSRRSRTLPPAVPCFIWCRAGRRFPFPRRWHGGWFAFYCDTFTPA